MGHLGVHIEPFFNWLLQTTLQASLLICLILLVQRMLARRLGVRGRYFLWLVLLARMALPWAPQSRLSVYNLLPFSPPEGHRLSAAGEAGRPGSTPVVPDGTAATTALASARPARDSIGGTESESHKGHWPGSRTVVFLSPLWLIGTGALAGHILAGSIRLWRIVRRARPVSDPRILDLLDECQRRIGTKTTVAVLATDELGCPALFGFLRPRLLLSGSAVAELSLDELRHVFLHELAHLKRHDILVGAVASALHVLHWFNPLIAFGLQRMRADRELACDGLALSVLAPDEACAYGRTIVRQIERLLAVRPRPLLAALSGDRARIRRRIAMISRFPRGAYRWSPLAIVLIGCLTCVALTNSRAVSPPLREAVEPVVVDWDEYAREDFPTTHQDRHANIQRACIRNLHTGKYLVVTGDTVTCDANEPGEAGLWEYRFDEIANRPDSTVYFYSVPAQKYLTSDEHGNLALDATGPVKAASWAAYPWPAGVRIISHGFKNGHLRVDERGHVKAAYFHRDSRAHWDIHTVWRVKTGDDRGSNPQWQREKIPGPD